MYSYTLCNRHMPRTIPSRKYNVFSTSRVNNNIDFTIATHLYSQIKNDLDAFAIIIPNLYLKLNCVEVKINA